MTNQLPTARSAVLYLFLALGALAPRASQAKPGVRVATVEILGARVLTDAQVRAFAGKPPSCGERAAWAPRAVERVVRKYRAKGYRFARGWFEVADDCRVRLEIDEGRMHRVVFGGTGGYKSFMLRVDINLPHDVFHGPTVRRALRELKEKHGLSSVYYRVRDSQLVTTELGGAVPQRVLKIFVVTRESFGWSLGVDLDATWGLLPKAGVTVRDVLFDDDRFHADAAVAVPYRKYLFEEDAKAQWVHGKLGVGYRLPAFADGHIAPLMTAGTSVSQYHRADLGLERFFLLRTRASLSAVLLLHPSLTISVGGGVIYDLVFLQRLVADAETPKSDEELIRGTAHLDVEWTFDPEILRLDQRDMVRLTVDFASASGDDWMLDSRIEGGVFFHLGMHDLILRARALYITGDVRFWDEEALAGSFQRVFFGNQYWVREALQLTAAFRLAVWEDTIKIGVFHDGSLFFDRSGGGRDFAAADGFGPSLHFLLFDLFALDVYYGFGFAPAGFDHTLSFRLQTVF